MEYRNIIAGSALERRAVLGAIRRMFRVVAYDRKSAGRRERVSLCSLEQRRRGRLLTANRRRGYPRYVGDVFPPRESAAPRP